MAGLPHGAGLGRNRRKGRVHRDRGGQRLPSSGGAGHHPVPRAESGHFLRRGSCAGKILPPAGSRDFFRVTLTGSGEADIAKLTRRFSAVPNLTLRDETLPPLDIWGDTGADTLEGVYFRLLREAMEADPDSREEIQLAAEISRKLLEGREVTL